MNKISVTWVDSTSGPQGWEWEEDIDDTLVTVKTAGYLYAETKKRLTIVSSYTDHGQVQGRITIPKCSIKSGYGKGGDNGKERR